MVLDLFRIVFAPVRRGLPTAYRSHRETYRIEIRKKSTAYRNPLKSKRRKGA